MITKTQILKELKAYKNFKSDVEFAKYLGITPSRLSNWFKRNTFNIDIIHNKFTNVSRIWLLTGEGSMLKDTTISNSVLVSGQNVKGDELNYGSPTDQDSLKKENEHLKMLLIEKDKQLEEKEKLIAEKERLINVLLNNKL